MTTLHFSANIHAPKQKVWDKLWDDASYRKWTTPFMDGSYAESDWNEGSKISFLTPGGEGMFGIIQEKMPPVQMTFKHLGEVKNGVEEIKDWGEATESYHLEEINGLTTVDVTLKMEQTSPGFEQYFENTFPNALAILKELSEQ